MDQKQYIDHVLSCAFLSGEMQSELIRMSAAFDAAKRAEVVRVLQESAGRQQSIVTKWKKKIGALQKKLSRCVRMEREKKDRLAVRRRISSFFS